MSPKNKGRKSKRTRSGDTKSPKKKYKRSNEVDPLAVLDNSTSSNNSSFDTPSAESPEKTPIRLRISRSSEQDEYIVSSQENTLQSYSIESTEDQSQRSGDQSPHHSKSDPLPRKPARRNCKKDSEIKHYKGTDKATPPIGQEITTASNKGESQTMANDS